MEDILPVCFQRSLIIRSAIIFLVIFPPRRKLIHSGRTLGAVRFIIKHSSLIEMVPDVLEAYQSNMISIADWLQMIWLLFLLLQTQ